MNGGQADDRPAWIQAGWPLREDKPSPNGQAAAPGDASPYAQAALSKELAELAVTTKGRRNGQLNIGAFNMAQLVAAGHLPHMPTWAALETVALSTGLEPAEVRNTLTSAFKAGAEQPRRVVLHQRDPAPEASTFVPPGEPLAAEGEEFPVLDWHALWDDDTEDEFIVYPLLPARRLVALFSPPKLGKSLLMLELAVAISRGEEVLGEQLTRPRRVLYVDFENDPRGDVRTRLQAMGRKPDDLAELHYMSFPRLPYLDTPMGGMVLLGQVAKHEAEVVVIDTISRAVGGEENDNDTWLSFYRHTGLALKAAGVTGIRLDHTGKDVSKGMRGGSAKYGDVDLVWSMTASGDGIVQLECTASRLPIGEKLLTLKREALPHFHHVVAPSARVDAERARDRELLEHVDRQCGPRTKVTVNQFVEAVKPIGGVQRKRATRLNGQRTERLLEHAQLTFEEPS